ncbi:MAG TPA: penicillin-binding protein 1C [Smithellaceae bacterium]|nr:penicillin-binding protein 1C [Smithellaceae bacterium]
MNRLLKYLLVLLTIGILFAGQAFAQPAFEEVRSGFVKSDSLLLDRNGNVLHELRTDKTGRRLDWTALADISPSLVAAIVASEDARFFRHAGVDYRAIGSAALSLITSGHKRGASTITMQLASLLDKSLQNKKERRTLSQKIRQINAARDLEARWNKNRILEAYLNLVTFRGEYQGVAAASRGFFGRDPHGLSQTHSLILASLIRAPNAAADLLNKRAIQLNAQLGWTVSAQQMLSEINSLYSGIHQIRPRIALAPHVARQLFKDKAAKAVIACTLDGALQKYTLENLSQQIAALAGQNVQEGAVLVLHNSTGEVLAYANYSNRPHVSGYVDGVLAKRQAGSTLKPFLYAAALDAEILTAASLLDDSPLDVAVASGIYQPDNYDSSYHGPVSARDALASSLNIPAVRVLSMVGAESFLQRLRRLGIKGLDESGDFYGLSLALGSADVTLWELTNAYRALANSGRWSEARLMKEASDQKIRSLNVFSAQASFIVSDILSDRKARSLTFGLENPLATRFWTAVKTGTSKDMRDNWCIGFSSRYTVGVWVGNYSGEPMWNVSGITGAAPVWTMIMNDLHREKPGIRPAAPKGIRKAHFRTAAGSDEEEWFLAGIEPGAAPAVPSHANPRIVYPPSGAILALDPDIPPSVQKVFFTAETREGDSLHWMLNSVPLETTGKSVSWTPVTGRHSLAIVSPENKIVDAVTFEVRGHQKE